MRRLAVLAVAVLALSSGASAAPPPLVGAYDTLSLPAWSPDGTKIAWAVDDGPGLQMQIWTADADGSNAKALVGPLRNGLFELLWPRPDELLYDANFRVFRASPDGRYRVVTDPTGSTFSTDAEGDRVASAFDRGPGPLTITTVATGKRVQLGGKSVLYGDPALSPDGAHVVFDRGVLVDPARDVVKGQGLWSARTDGAGARSLRSSGSCPVWSPAGDAIAYGVLGTNGLSLWTMAPDGTHRRELLQRGPVCSVPASLAWSPDGRTIAYVQPRTGRLVLLDVASRRTTLVRAFGQAIGIAWSPDGTRLLVAARPAQGACASLWEVGSDGAGAVLVRRCSTA